MGRNDRTFTERIKNLEQMILHAKKGVVFLGGAGISTASGIPDFRSETGLYNQADDRFKNMRPEYLLSRTCLEQRPELFFRYFREKLDLRNAEPNAVHKKLAEMEEKGFLNGIITQNIDGLHQKAGSRNVCEIHGTASKCSCMFCKTEYPPEAIYESEDIPVCNAPDPVYPSDDNTCGGIIRPEIVLYGEALPSGAWTKAVSLMHNSDLLIVAGTSLSVYPAAGLMKEFFGKNTVIINKEKTEYDHYSGLIFREPAEKVFAALEF